jgi:hypothetical protein
MSSQTRLSDRSTGEWQSLLHMVRATARHNFFNYCAATFLSIDARQYFCQLMRGNISVN